MRWMRSVVFAVSFLSIVTVGCAVVQVEPTGPNAPKVELERVEVASYFPYAPPPARVPLILAFVFNVANPSDIKVALEEMKFAVSFEAKGTYFGLSNPTVYETMWIPARTTNQLRVVVVLDSAIVPATLAVRSGIQVAAIGMKPPDIVKAWWEQIGDFAFGIRVSEGVAIFSIPEGSTLVAFEGGFPKK